MKNRWFKRSFLAPAVLIILAAGCQKEQKEQKEVSVDTREEQVSYAIGLEFGRDVRKEQLGLDQELVIRGINNGFSSTEPALDAEELEKARAEFLQKREAGREEIAEKNRAEGEAFLAENAQKEGVETLPSDLQYKIITPGDGAQPSVDDNVKVHFRGYFIDGTEFENTYANNQPAVYPVRGVIPGWTEALQLMKEGAKWKLYVPAELAYGEKGAGNIIEPGKTLIFELEFIGIH